MDAQESLSLAARREAAHRPLLAPSGLMRDLVRLRLGCAHSVPTGIPFNLTQSNCGQKSELTVTRLLLIFQRLTKSRNGP